MRRQRLGGLAFHIEDGHNLRLRHAEGKRFRMNPPDPSRSNNSEMKSLPTHDLSSSTAFSRQLSYFPGKPASLIPARKKLRADRCFQKRELANSPSPRERRQLAVFVESVVLNEHQAR